VRNHGRIGLFEGLAHRWGLAIEGANAIARRSFKGSAFFIGPRRQLAALEKMDAFAFELRARRRSAP
jgi:hypothetical protein